MNMKMKIVSISVCFNDVNHDLNFGILHFVINLIEENVYFVFEYNRNFESTN